MQHFLFWLLCGIALVCAIDGLRAYRRNTSVYEFFLMSGRLRVPQFVSTVLATNLSLGNFLIFVASWGYLYGRIGIAWFTVNLILNAVAFLLFLPRIRSYLEDRSSGGTIHDFIVTRLAPAHPLGRPIRLLASLTTVVGLLLALAFELHLATILVAPVLRVDVVVLFCTLAILICIYTALGGFRIVVSTDIFQSVGLVATAGALIWLFISVPDPPESTVRPPIGWFDIGVVNITSICVVGSGWFLVAMDNWQRMSATRSATVTRAGFGIYTGIVIGFGILFGYVGMWDRTHIPGILPPSMASQYTSGGNAFQDMLLLAGVPGFEHGAVLAVVAAGLVMAAISTADTFLIVCSHSFVNDIMLQALNKSRFVDLKPVEDRAYVGIARSTSIAMSVAVILTWVSLVRIGILSDALSFFFIAYSVQYSLLAAVVAAACFPSRVSPCATFVSIALGIMTALGVGFGSWIALGNETASMLWLSPAEWLTLSPVVTVVASSLPYAFSELSFLARGRSHAAADHL